MRALRNIKTEEGFPLESQTAPVFPEFPLLKMFTNERSGRFHPHAAVTLRGAETLQQQEAIVTTSRRSSGVSYDS